ncbi:hypothetical protein L226DRAFT_615626 [Lentinus tigrinus ALCF2SS1-7]|uniref:F-box domain-containing protein n=1 Tax=Lentinus tigrinus ALCF2SS1-6 TaxID=1328759 RepID=A0A5C2RWM5_9APHY|nr:hypothetical protein L227DRAFT_603611 [Lentinus tigrinus ALCF2SS1-6]RPD71354.1 hypothetical protein L226DRAFT_615626 [Lentinus tigrinus ALCF2SS1-7]
MDQGRDRDEHSKLVAVVGTSRMAIAGASASMSPGTSGVILPVELLHIIFESVDRSDLYFIALSSRTLNKIVTPALYSNIDLDLPHTIYACVRTLASVPRRTAFNRDLAGFVETISLRDLNDWIELPSALQRKQRSVVGRRLAKAIPRMKRIRSITCRIRSLPHTLQVFTTLASGAFPHIDAIDMNVCFPSHWSPTLTSPIAGIRGLKILRLDSDDFGSFMCSILTGNYNTLKSLVFTDRLHIVWHAWKSIPSFPALEELGVQVQVLSERAFQDTSSVRRFILPCWDIWDDVAMPSNVLPNLEDVTCYPVQLRAFLLTSASHKRPISTVTLNHLRYERCHRGGCFGMEDRFTPYDFHHNIGPTVQALRFSSAPLRRLSFCVQKLSVSALSDLLPLTDLEYLLIALDMAPGEDDTDDIFALAPLLDRMPRMHTLLLSDVTKKMMNECFAFAHDEAYQRRALAAYDEHSSFLRRVAFTTEFEWEKRQDGWHPWGHVVAEREILSDGEDDESIE